MSGLTFEVSGVPKARPIDRRVSPVGDGRAATGYQLWERHVFLGRGPGAKGTKLLRRHSRHLQRSKCSLAFKDDGCSGNAVNLPDRTARAVNRRHLLLPQARCSEKRQDS